MTETRDQTLAGRVALVTGAGNGIGRATALKLAARGAIVGVNDLKPEFVDSTVSAIKAAGGNAVAVAQDVSSRDGMRQAVLGLAQQQGRFDILVNNAAWVRYQSVPDIAPETVDRMLNIGFKAIIWGIQAAAEVMDAERGGAIVNVASVAGLISAKNSIVYSGIKAGVMGITRAAAAEPRRTQHPRQCRGALSDPDRGNDAKPQCRGSTRAGWRERRWAGSARSTTSPRRSASSPATRAASSRPRCSRSMAASS